MSGMQMLGSGIGVGSEGKEKVGMGMAGLGDVVVVEKVGTTPDGMAVELESAVGDGDSKGFGVDGLDVGVEVIGALGVDDGTST